MALNIARRGIYTCARRYLSVSATQCDKMMPDPFEHATGIEKQEMLARRAGNNDPFDMGLYHRGVGTKEQPNLIPSRFQCRIVGCVCEEDATCVNYMWLKAGEPKRCECGHWFKLVEGAPLPALE
ncbi:Cytochrome c oxidase subunit 5B, mitochondrial [Amphibalanus amphitrite]|uniref:Cytochrome c oxidase subunit 5B, mitochondrial n=1 Tax=Amphibalanus amphitrite TaxID=1232801 RepID=A0A6A4WHZ7_AMPAM|nr:cytochrome c oxidase subunit 5B, mitochondrial-like [Amphibalanus amphitrite]XP_043241692.1 cytochrome c oxidase subunit 5B, mitochondrial-like [Amphibalanus amphitrite]KAF0307106.1 Cytochrome c oxidase subunit 5B, mitochondrial [Amphibalanus amphitrite]KAF0313928.1 Cytochrome c oxidase subunit 5B, mitochondrial [Amphibalanus amphitrite]